jgi:hypothetical protein
MFPGLREDIWTRDVDLRARVSSLVDRRLGPKIAREVRRAGGSYGRHTSRKVQGRERALCGYVSHTGRVPNSVEQVIVHADEPWKNGPAWKIDDLRSGRRRQGICGIYGNNAPVSDDHGLVFLCMGARSIDYSDMRHRLDRGGGPHDVAIGWIARHDHERHASADDDSSCHEHRISTPGSSKA